MSGQEQEFKIQPHPAKDNIAPSFPGSDAEGTAGLGGSPNLAHLHKAQDPTQAKGPHIPSEEVAKGLEQPKSREDLQGLAKSLNE
ncbi:BQ2448_2389 [Microbotryum intermedium]|uniref:BQ2448_2389 protein n=1 Tax=Microbotryum intermedium TaxID=269621 RepID=A0A238F9D7_9BASI|nr:BQ2448_2389 [Microbotryum intermedium]